VISDECFCCEGVSPRYDTVGRGKYREGPRAGISQRAGEGTARMADPGAFRFVVAEPFHAAALDRLRQFGTVRELASFSPQTLLEAVSEADALLVRSRTHVTARILEAGTRLKVIGRASASCDHIDLRVARQRHIGIVYAPVAATRSLVEFTVAMILAAQRRLLFYDRKLRAGEFASLRQPMARELHRLTLGLLGVNLAAEGVGRIMAGAFGCRVIFHDPTGGRPVELQATEVDLETLLKTSDIVSLHLPLRPATRQILNAERLAMLSPDAILVNTSRGGLIDTDALAGALKEGKLTCAALDVFETEPLPLNHPLRNAPHCILTPHVGCVTRDSDEAVFDVVDDVIRVLQGEAPRFPVPIEGETESAFAPGPAARVPESVVPAGG